MARASAPRPLLAGRLGELVDIRTGVGGAEGRPQSRVRTAGGEQIVVAADLDDPAVGEDTDPTSERGLSMAKKTLTMTCPEDVLAAVPLLMGFTPTSSLIFVSVQGCQMHARIDHPRTADEFEVAADQMVTAMSRNGVGACLLLSYVEDARRGYGGA